MRIKPVFVYVDWTEEEIPRPFYVGLGHKRRVNAIHRNNKHTGMRRKFGFHREIVFGTADRDAAQSLEIQLIAEYKTYHYDDIEGIGCNFTRGGECGGKSGKIVRGFSGKKHTEQSRALIRERRSKQVIKHSEETRLKIGKAHKGMKQRPETIAQFSKSLTGKKYPNRKKPAPFTEEHRKNMGEATRKRYAAAREKKKNAESNGT